MVIGVLRGGRQTGSCVCVAVTAMVFSVAVRFWLAFVAVGPLKVTPIVAMISLVAPVSSASVMWLRGAPLTVNVAVGTSSLVSPLGAAKAAVPMVRSAPRCSPRAIRLIVQVFVSVSPGTISWLVRVAPPSSTQPAPQAGVPRSSWPEEIGPPGTFGRSGGGEQRLLTHRARKSALGSRVTGSPSALHHGVSNCPGGREIEPSNSSRQPFAGKDHDERPYDHGGGAGYSPGPRRGGGCHASRSGAHDSRPRGMGPCVLRRQRFSARLHTGRYRHAGRRQPDHLHLGRAERRRTPAHAGRDVRRRRGERLLRRRSVAFGRHAGAPDDGRTGLSPAFGDHLRYFALPSTTPECDSFLAKQSCGAKWCVSHQSLASFAEENRSRTTVIQK